MKIKFTYIIFLGILFFSFLACTPKKGKDKLEYNGKLKYFTDRTGKEHALKNNSNDVAFIILPQCFKEEMWSAIGIKNDLVYYCDKNSTYFNIDILTEEEVDELISINNKSSKDKIIQLSEEITSRRNNSLVDASTSITTKTKTETKQSILLKNVIGKRYSNDSELFYQYGFIQKDDLFFVIQAVLSSENSRFLHEDIITIFKSFELN